MGIYGLVDVDELRRMKVVGDLAAVNEMAEIDVARVR